MNAKDISGAPFQILSLSGGGFRGLFTAKALEALEAQAGKPIGQCFDLICGTSIGGIIAMALGLEIPAKRIAKIIEENGERIFHDDRSVFWKWLCRFKFIDAACHLHKPRYSNQNLSDTVKEILGERKLGDSKHRLLITSYNYTDGALQMFKTRHHEDFKLDHKLPMAHIAMATSAAPTYFPVWQDPDSRKTYLDGGIVANAPGQLALHEAGHFLGVKQSDIRLLSVGTMNSSARLGSAKDLNKGLAWGGEIFDAMISAQENMANDMLTHILGESYACINAQPQSAEEKTIGLDKTGDDAKDILKAHASQAAQDFLGKPIAQTMLARQSPSFTPISQE